MRSKICSALISVTVLFSSAAFGAAKVIKESKTEWVAEASASYVLGDNDTRIDARNIALNEAKRAASEIVGSHVKTDLVIQNDEVLKDQITVITAAFMKVEVLSENMSVSKDKRSVMDITIRAHLDKSAIQDQLDAYKGDESRQKTMSSVQAENVRLQKELDALNAELTKVRSASDDGIVAKKPDADLLSRRDTLISELEENQGQIRRVFEKGSLLTMAKKNSDEYIQAVEKINQQFFGYVQKNTKVTMSDPKFLDNGNGTYDVVAGLSWKIDSAPVYKLFKPYFNFDKNEEIDSWDSDKGTCFSVDKVLNEDEGQKKPFTNKLYSELSTKSIVIRVSIGSNNANLTIAQEGEGVRGYAFRWMPSGHPKMMLSWQEHNPMVIKNVPAALLNNLTIISTEVIVTK